MGCMYSQGADFMWYTFLQTCMISYPNQSGFQLIKITVFDTINQKGDFFLFFFCKQMKRASQNNEGTVGLLTYPVLQAADILLYK